MIDLTIKMKKQTTFSNEEPYQSKISDNKIEVLNCPLKSLPCRGHIIELNRCYLDSEKYQKEKNFERSIEILKSAFFKTTELNDHPCANCSLLFRSMIIDSMKNIYNELDQMSKGFFGTKRYHLSYLSAGLALKEFENLKS